MYLQKADERKLKGMGANQSSISRIMGDIYGVRSGPVEQLGMADADDPDDFDAKVSSLEHVWENIIPGFNQWFVQKRAEKFKANLVLTARKALNSGRFYTNGLEGAHPMGKVMNSSSSIQVNGISGVLFVGSSILTCL